MAALDAVEARPRYQAMNLSPPEVRLVQRNSPVSECGHVQREIRPLLRLWLRLTACSLFVCALPVCVAGQKAPGASNNAPYRSSALLAATDTVFTHLNREKGLDSTTVTAFAQDAEGFLWIGTQSGVSRWDGYQMRSYHLEPGNEESLPDDIIKTLFTDPMGRLWIGTNSGGLARYDHDGDRFIVYPEEQTALNHGRIGGIASDGASGLWIGTDAGLDHLNPETKVFVHYHGAGYVTPGASALDGRRVTSLLRQKDGSLLVGTNTGLFRSDPAQGRVEQQNFTPVPILTPGGSPAAIMSLFSDTTGRLWIGTQQGAFLLDPGGPVARQVHETGASSPLDDERISAISEAQPGVVWIGTYGQGIVAVDNRLMTTHRIVHDIALPTSLSDDTVDVLFSDRQGLMWVGTHRGADASNAAQSGIWTLFGGASRKDGPTNPDILSILPLDDGRVWLVNNAGVDILDHSWVRMRTLLFDPASPRTTLPKGIYTVEKTPGGTVYIGTQKGLFRTDSAGDHLQRVALKDETLTSSELNITSICFSGGQVWAGTMEGLWSAGISEGSKLARVQLQGHLTDPRISVLRHGQGHDLWIGTQSGLNRLDLRTFRVEQVGAKGGDQPAPGHAFVSSMLLDARGRLWVGTFGTSGGIYVLVSTGTDGQPRFRRLTEGLPNLNIDTMLQTGDESVWATTDEGIAAIDPETLSARTFKAADGLAISSYWTNSGATLKDGTMLFGGVGGLTMIQPSMLTQWVYRPPVVVTNIRVGDETTLRGLVAHADKAIDRDGSIRIRPENNRLTVEFAALDYSAPEQNRYAYRLEGYDRDWVTTDASRRVATYTNLAPGSYILMLRGSNHAGLWGEVREVRFQVLPAWYQTLTFHILVFVTALLLLGVLYLVTSRVQRRRQRELERKVAVRTAQLEQTTTELQNSHRRLEEMAFSDSLTGLPNRRFFSQYFRHQIALQQRDSSTFALLMFDLDHFKGINDKYGHDAGDAVLKAVAMRLPKLVRASDCFARLGGDEFAILLSGPIDAAGVALVCDRMLASFIEPVSFNALPLKATLSIGAAFCPTEGASEEHLYKLADMALYRAKNNGKNGWSL